MNRAAWWAREGRAVGVTAAVFALCWLLPVGRARFDGALLEALHLVRWYAREHVLLCLVPAFFLAGAISVFVSQGSVLRYLGARAHRVTAYGVASVSGAVLAVCSCTVLPLFAGIYRRGAGLGPATAFLYAGPAINVLAIALTARLLGAELGIARAVGAVAFSVVIGLTMQALFRGEDLERTAPQRAEPVPDAPRPRGRAVAIFTALLAVLLFTGWSGGSELLARPVVTVAFALGTIALVLLTAGRDDDLGHWFDATWQLARQILPLLLLGVLAAGLLLGRPGHEGLVPSTWVERAVGGESPAANLFASVAGALLYFATLTEVPIVQGLVGAGMGKGPALALLLAGPALSLPNMLVIRSVLGTRKTLTYVALVVAMATVSGILYGRLLP